MQHYFTSEPVINEQENVALKKQRTYPLLSKADLEPSFKRIGEARIIMLGAASYGIHEYLMWRTYFTQKLIEEKNFHFIAVKGDLPVCYLLNRYIIMHDKFSSAITYVQHEFNRRPIGLWANRQIDVFAKWLFLFTAKKYISDKIGFYGLDVYSLWESKKDVLSYLSVTDIEVWKADKKAFQCFELYHLEEGIVNYQTPSKLPLLWESAVLHLLEKIPQKLPTFQTDRENGFTVEKYAFIAVHAEKYYRIVYKGRVHNWYVRERHMSDTLDRLLKFHGNDSKVSIWAHNTNIGDTRATNMIGDGMLHVGEMVSSRHPEKGVVLVCFGSFQGSVAAPTKWRADMQVFQMSTAQKGSWEYHLHSSGIEKKLLPMDDFAKNDQLMEKHIGHRSIGVVYNPAYKQYGNYVPSIMPLRYEALIYLDKTNALHPLYFPADRNQIPETYSFGV